MRRADRDVLVAVVQVDVRGRESSPFVFVKTFDGWKFSPKQ
jgi:hypothetical protein